VVVPLIILVKGHEANVSQVGLRYVTYGMDTITFDDFPSILFISMELAILRFVELAHTLNHYKSFIVLLYMKRICFY